METDDDYLALVDSWVVNEAHRCADFGQLLAALPGVYPTTAARSVERLIAVGGAAKALHPAALLDGHSIDRASSDLGLPIPHPLDYDWRFSATARSLLLDRCAALTNDGSAVFIGAPTLLAHARSTGFEFEAVLLDRNPALFDHFATTSERHKVIRCDIGVDSLPHICPQPRIVVLDPPWYPEHMFAFLWAAAMLTTTGGSVLLSMPPVGTRPGVVPERVEILAFAGEVGLDVTSVEAGVLPYVSPPFERAALVAEGLLGVPLDWRRGDLVTFRRTLRPAGVRPRPPDIGEAWVEERLRGTRLRLRVCEHADGYSVPRLSPVVAGDVLCSVSRRDPRRARIDLWTLGNRVFSVQGHDALLRMVRAIHSERDPERALREDLGREPTADEWLTARATIGRLLDIMNHERYGEA